MTDRIRVLTVILDRDYREDDDCKVIVDAIRMIRGVAKVDKRVVDHVEHMVRLEIGAKVAENLLDMGRLAYDGKGPLFEGVKKKE